MGDKHSWFCNAVIPPLAMPTGAGAYCYNVSQDCLDGPNACSNATGGQACVIDWVSCATGMASPTVLYWFCPLDGAWRLAMCALRLL